MGKGFCCRIDAPNLDLWERVWHLIDDHGGICDDLTVEYTPAHPAARDDETLQQQVDREGNAMADKMWVRMQPIRPADRQGCDIVNFTAVI